VAVVQGADACLEDVGRCRPVGLAEFEVDHMATGRFEAARRDEHLERAFARKSGDSFGRRDGHVARSGLKAKRPLS